MVGPAADPGKELHHLTEQARLLRERSRQILLALAITEDLRAEMLRRLRRRNNPRSTGLALAEKRAETAADDYRSFARRIGNGKEASVS